MKVNLLISGTVSGNQTSATISPQRIHTVEGLLQYTVFFTGVATFSLELQGRANVTDPWAVMNTFTEADTGVTPATYLSRQAKVAIMPQMRAVMTTNVGCFNIATLLEY